MARTKQCARKKDKVAKSSNEGSKLPKVSQKSKNDKAVGSQDEVNFFQHRGEIVNEPAQSSLVHAFNNAVGSPLLGPVDMYNARIDLLKVASKSNIEGLYLGTDESGIGDWPIEVLMCALGYNFHRRCVTVKKVNYGGSARGNVNVTVAALESHVTAGFDLIVELQFPATPNTATTTTALGSSSSGGGANANVNANIGSSSGSGSDRAQRAASRDCGADLTEWLALPLNSLGERGHFIAVRNGLVYDSIMPADQPALEMARYPHWRYIYRAYRLNVACSGDGGAEDAGQTAVGSNSTPAQLSEDTKGQTEQSSRGSGGAPPSADEGEGAAEEGLAEGEGEGHSEGNYEYRHRDRDAEDGADSDSAEGDEEEEGAGTEERGMYW